MTRWITSVVDLIIACMNVHGQHLHTVAFKQRCPNGMYEQVYLRAVSKRPQQ